MDYIWTKNNHRIIYNNYVNKPLDGQVDYEDIKKQLVIYKDGEQVAPDGLPWNIRYGTTFYRPKGIGATGGVLDPNRDIGFRYFDTSIGKPIYAQNIANDGTVAWVDATGAMV